MKKFSIMAVIAILLVCVISVPTWTNAESCPSVNSYVSKYFNMNGKVPYKKENNIVTFSIKKEYLNYIKVYVNDLYEKDGDQHTGLTQPDANGNITLDLIADQNAGYTDTTIRFYFTPSPDMTNAKDCGTRMKYYSFAPTVSSQQNEDDEEIKQLERELGTLPDTDASLDDLKDDTFTKVTDMTKSNKLTCDYGKTDGKTVKKYTHTSTKKTTSRCSTTCREDLVVTLDPPVITQAGMCFSYVVDIKSKVTCSSKFTGTKPRRYTLKVSSTEMCNASTTCNSGSDVGGPDADFDSCVESCDNGEYTQACIDKCYTKVYEKDSTKEAKNTTTKTTKKTDSKDYLKQLKTTNTFVEPQKLASSLKTVNVGVAKVTCYTDDYLQNHTKGLNDEQLTALANDVYNSKQYLPGGYYGDGKDEYYMWNPSNEYFSYDVKNGSYKLNASGGCSSKISPYYFSSKERTKTTIKQLNGTLYYHNTNRIHKYVPSGQPLNNVYVHAGSLMRHSISYDNGATFITSECGDICTIATQCSSIISGFPGNKKHIATEKQAQMIYKAELQAYKNEKESCVRSSKSCYTTATSTYTIKVDETSKNTGNNLGNSYKAYQKVDQGKSGNNKSKVTGNNKTMIINTNGKCITGECANKNQEYCSNLDKNSSDYKAYCDDKNSCKLSGVPACKNGNTCYDYHTTLSFPKNYINVKTGQTKVEITKDKLPFYVAIGNSYCTNLSTKEVNVNWYDYKIDDTNKVAKPKKINKYNIKGTIRNYGYSKWNFDFSCFYALKNPDTGDCVGDNCTPKDCVGNNCTPCTGSKCNNGGNGENIISKVKVRSVNLSNLFPNRTPRFNWSNEAKNVNNRNYKVDPSTLVKAIETTGDTVYDKDKENKYLDYHIKLTKSAITKIRNYNKGKTYNNSNNGSPVNRINGEGTWGVTVYRSKLLDKLGKKVVTKRGLLGCNNQTSSRSCNQQGGN